ncbi:hypothetical protein E4U13_003833 [Claviceps humidiphila]|uniref:Uncharacterized protein n=1 Tax=Claviceps humidiphila TaxID=1294629 RepID=A0A9P7TXH7_9HYPO|nr:hypothetical protein E4U13_003833 [Claviceps humidiphila]
MEKSSIKLYRVLRTPGVTQDSRVKSRQKYEVGFEEHLQLCKTKTSAARAQPPSLERKPRPRGVDAGIDPPNASGNSKTRFPENAVHSLRKSGHESTTTGSSWMHMAKLMHTIDQLISQ